MSKTAVTLEEIYQPIDTRIKAVPASILKILSTDNPLAGDVVHYFFSAMGKLLRPAMTFLGAAAVNRPMSEALESRLLALGASYEIFHAATLIHDDIIDSSFLRRNIPTVNVKWNSQVAVLVGDFLHNKAIDTIFAQSTPEIFSLFLNTARMVCDGEIQELKEKGNYQLTEENYFEIIDKKTAVLLACAVRSGAMLAGATELEAVALFRYGTYFGQAFQIIDDCLDFTGQEQEFGKTLGADCAAGVLTLPVIRLLEITGPLKREEILCIFQSSASEKYETLLDLVREYGVIDYAAEKAQQLSEKARLELAIFPENPGRRSLEKLVDYVLDRSR